MRIARLASLLLAVPAALHAAPLGIAKSSAVVSDPQGNLLPRRVPGALVDYTVSISNPVSNGLSTVEGISFVDVLPAQTALRVADLGLLNSGPIVVVPGLSGLSYSFGGLTSTTDSIDFSSDRGATWTYLPSADANGVDRRVSAIRIRLSGRQAAGTSASLRFRILLL